jgi:hypothetical protein
MTHPIPPTRPSPYIAPGNGWTLNVQVPGFGRWSRNPQQVSSYTVYNHGQRDYHITIDTAYLNDPSRPMNTHVTSNNNVGTRVLHWPGPGLLSVAQQAWMAQNNGAGQFDALIAAFENELRTRAANIQASRDYDAAMVEYREQRILAAAQRRANAATFEGDLADWLDAYDPADYLNMFEAENQWYVLDPDRGVVVWLDPKPLPVLVSSSTTINKGFYNLCAQITGEVHLGAVQWGLLSAQLTILRRDGKTYAMLNSDFLACQPAKNLLSLDQLVDHAVDEWAGAVTSSAPYTMIASDRSVMNVNSNNGAHYCVQMLDLVDLTELTLFGAAQARTKTGTLSLYANLPGVYEISCVSELQTRLPQVIRINREHQPDVYILKDKLAKEWSSELVKVSSVNPAALADDLARTASCQVFVDNLLLDEQEGLTVYLLLPDGSTYYVGPKDEVVPEVKVKSLPFSLHDQARQLKTYLGGMSITLVAQGVGKPIVVCGDKGTPVTPYIFLDLTKLSAFDLAAARKDFVLKQQQRQEREERAAEEVKATVESAVAEYSEAWNLAHPSLQKPKNTATLLLYATPAGALVAVVSGSPNHLALQTKGASHIDTIEFVYTSYTKTNRGFVRNLEIGYGNPASLLWVEQLKKYIVNDKTSLPSGTRAYVVEIKKH